MLKERVDVQQCISPIPITMLIKAASSFDCDIFIENGGKKVNVKCYEDLKRGLVTRTRHLLFYFEGKDEDEAGGCIRMLFEP